MAIISGEIFTSKTLGSSGSSFNSSAPLNTFYKYYRSEMIILASELTALGLVANSTITELRIYISGVPTQNITNSRIAIGHTALTNWGTTATNTMPAMSTLTQVYSGTELFANMTASTWYAFVFQTPFTWNGTSNILIDWTKDTTNSANSGLLDYRIGVGYNGFVGWRADSGTYPFDNAGSLSQFNSQNFPRLWIVGNTTPSGGVIDAGTISLSADTTLSASPSVFLGGLSTLMGDTNLSVNGGIIIDNPALYISADSSIIADGGLVLDSNSVTITGNATLSTAGSLILGGTSVISADGTMTPNGSIIASGLVSIYSEGLINVDADVLTTDSSAILSADSTLTATGVVILGGSVSISADTSLITTGGSIIAGGLVVISADTLLSATGNIVYNADSRLSGISQLTVDGDLITLELSANLDGIVHLSASGGLVINGDALLSANTTLLANGVLLSDLLNQVYEKIYLMGSKELRIFLEGDRNLGIILDGSRQQKIILKGNREASVRMDGKRTIKINLRGDV